MLNGSKGGSFKADHTSAIVGYRNAKYQGEISDYERLPYGIGMFLNIDYLLVIASWEAGAVKGECVSVFPDGGIFYGNVQGNKPMGMGCYQLSENKIVYSFLNNQVEDTYFIDCCESKTLVIMKMAASYRNQLLLPSTKQDNSEGPWAFVYNEIGLKNKRMEIVKEFLYSRQDEKWQIIEKYAGQVVSNEYKGFKLFLKYYFNTRISTKQNRLELAQTSDYLELRYKKTGIVCRIAQHQHNSNRVKFVGYYDCYEEQSDVYRKNKGSSSQFQEYCQGYAISYNNERPSICKANLQLYFRKSIHFVNRFVSVKYLDEIKSFYETINSFVQIEISTKNAQIQLQMGHFQPHQAEVLRSRDKMSYNQSFKNLELEDVKLDIYNRVKKKKNSSVENYQTSRMLTYSQKSDYKANNYQLKENYDYVSPKLDKNKDNFQDTSPKKRKLYLKYAQNSGDRARPELPEGAKGQQPKVNKKKYVYMINEDSHSRSDLVQKNQNKPPQSFKYHNHSDYSFYNQEKRNPKYQKNNYMFNQPKESIGLLMNNYQKLKYEIRQERRGENIKENERQISPSNFGTPTHRSPSRYNYFRSPYISPGGTTAKGRQHWR